MLAISDKKLLRQALRESNGLLEDAWKANERLLTVIAEQNFAIEKCATEREEWNIERKNWNIERKALMEEIAQLKGEKSDSDKRLEMYENAHSPPSQNSIPTRQRKAEKKKKSEDRNPSGRKKGSKCVSHDRKSDRTVKYECDSCGHCGGKNLKIVSTRTKQTHDIEEMPKVETATHVSYTYKCADCKKETKTKNNTIPGTSLGPNISTILGTGYTKTSSLDSLQSTAASLNIKTGKTAIMKAIRAMAKMLEPVRNSIKESAASSTYLKIDETPFPIFNRNGWAWLGITDTSVLVHVTPSRSGLVLDDFLPHWHIPITCDGFAAYLKFLIRQRCWAHMLRELRALKDISPRFSALYDALNRLYDDAKLMQRASEDDPHVDTSSLEARMLAIVARLRELGQDKIATKYENATPNLFTFINYPGMDPTNNEAERMIRPLVVHRKVRQHIMSAEGAEVYSIMMTCALTWRKQGLDVSKMLRKALTFA